MAREIIFQQLANEQLRLHEFAKGRMERPCQDFRGIKIGGQPQLDYLYLMDFCQFAIIGTDGDCFLEDKRPESVLLIALGKLCSLYHHQGIEA